MADHLSETVTAFATAIGPEPGEVLREMDEKARGEGFPHVGPAVGGWLATLARLTDARRIFEFGSGFGYSACWFARELAADGEIVLTEIDADELDEAREFLAAAGHADRARFEHGDAIDTVERYDGPFDVVLIDNEKHRYAEAFEAVRGKIADGGVVAADNAIAGGNVDVADLVDHFGGGSPAMNENTAGIADYVETVRADDAFETALLPLGEGVTISVKR